VVVVNEIAIGPMMTPPCPHHDHLAGRAAPKERGLASTTIQLSRVMILIEPEVMITRVSLSSGSRKDSWSHSVLATETHSVLTNPRGIFLVLQVD
jgi:hypothetical protein